MLGREVVSARRLLKSLGDPDLDPDWRVTPIRWGLAVERLDHPRGEIDVDPALLTQRAPRGVSIQMRADVLARVEPLVRLTRFDHCEAYLALG